jgi:hypothetical protein
MCETPARSSVSEEATDLDVLGDVVGVTLARLGRVREPLRTVVRRDSEAESVGVYFLTHFYLAFAVGAFAAALGAAFFAGGSRNLGFGGAEHDGDVARALEDLERATLSTRLEALHRGSFVNENRAMTRSASSMASLVLSAVTRAFATCRGDELVHRLARTLRGELEDRECFLNVLAADHVDDSTGLLRGDANVLELGDGFNHDVYLLAA